jgi:hypothetical protein
MTQRREHNTPPDTAAAGPTTPRAAPGCRLERDSAEIVELEDLRERALLLVRLGLPLEVVRDRQRQRTEVHHLLLLRVRDVGREGDNVQEGDGEQHQARGHLRGLRASGKESGRGRRHTEEQPPVRKKSSHAPH